MLLELPVRRFATLRPFSGSRAFPTAVELYYPIDLIGKYVWLLLSIGIRRPRHVIKAKASELQLLRTHAGRGRIFLENPALSGLPVVMLHTTHEFDQLHRPTSKDEVRARLKSSLQDDLPSRRLRGTYPCLSMMGGSL